jgi:signal transduction histidine kinase
VQDEGPGIDLVDADRIFALFQRVNGSGSKEGSGVGLAVCRKIAERHGGSIKAEPAADRGTRFTVVLPKVQTAGSERAGERELPVPSEVRL